MALSEVEIKDLTREDYERKLDRAYDILINSGAHYVVDSIVNLPQVLTDINDRLKKGEKP